MNEEAFRLEAPIREAIERVEDRLIEEQLDILDEFANGNLSRTARRARIAEMVARLETELDDLAVSFNGWVTREFPAIYAEGARLSAGSLIAGEFVWSQLHRTAIEALARDTFRDVLTATQYVGEDVKRWARDVGRMASEGVLIEGASRDQMSRAMRRGPAGRLKGMPVPAHSVTYRNGARVGLKQYTEMLVRTKTAQAYNSGTVNQAVELGVRRFETFDGSGCGWLGHNDANPAHGRIVTAQQAAATPISHPNCVRSFGPRPDLDYAAPEFVGPLPTTIPGQRAPGSEAFERVPNSSRAAQGRTARTARSGRTPRNPGN